MEMHLHEDTIMLTEGVLISVVTVGSDDEF
jgi:hypothetical protein